MKKNYSLLLIITILYITVSCSKTNELNPYKAQDNESNSFTISRSEALKLVTVANVGSSSNARKTGTKSKIVKEVKEFTNKESKVVFFVINYENDQGSLLMSADRRLKPVLAFSETESFDLNTDNPGVQLWKDYIVENFNVVQKKEKAHIDIKNLWKQFESGSFKFEDPNGRTSSEPVWTPAYSCEWWSNHPVPPNVTKTHLTATYSLWKQNAIGYNAYCPPAVTTANCSSSQYPCGRTFPGCGPIAVGQVLKYYKRPVTINGHAYTTAMFNSMYPALPSVCNSTDANSKNVALLLRDAGVELGAVYNTSIPVAPFVAVSGSGCQTWNTPGNTDNFFSNHGFTSFDVDFFSNEPTVKQELLASRPVIVFGSNWVGGLTNAHIWIMDGVKDVYNVFQDVNGFCYEQNDVYYQMNWGWGQKPENETWFSYTHIIGDGVEYNSSNMKAYIIRPL